MKKDVIYVDIDDDITSIIEKVKAAPNKIVALVPPKRIGVLQSIVNLKLMQRTAETAGKRIVMITNDPALTALAAGVAMPVAKNLQSKPEIAPVSALSVDDEDVIDGGDLPVGDHAASAKSTDTSMAPMDVDQSSRVASSVPLAMAAAEKAPKKSLSIPDFDTFRKKIFIFGGLGVLLIGFLVWAIWFAPRATIAITAQTAPFNVNRQLTLKPNSALDVESGTIAPISKEIKKSNTVDFEATGKKEVGEYATGSVKFSTNSISNLGLTIPEGTPLTSSSGLVFVTTEAVTFTISNYSGVMSGVKANDRGAKYNGASGAVSGAPNGVSATLTAATAGGTDKTVTVISADDVTKAKEKLTTQDSNAVKAELKKQFSGSQVVIEESFYVAAGEPVATPAVDAEASSGKLVAETVYSVQGLDKPSLEKIIKADVVEQLKGTPNQKIYDTGLGQLKFRGYSKQDGGAATTTLTATSMVGPIIDDKKLAGQLVGKRIGEIQAYVQGIEGVDSVETDLSPFWVTKAPSQDRITIKFVVRNEAN